MSLVDYSTARQGQPALRRDRARRLQPGLWLAWTVLALAFVAAVAPQLFTTIARPKALPARSA